MWLVDCNLTQVNHVNYEKKLCKLILSVSLNDGFVLNGIAILTKPKRNNFDVMQGRCHRSELGRTRNA